MSAMTLDAPASTPTVRTTTPLSRFTILLRREYWEHRGGFLRAPLWASAGFFTILLLVVLAAEWQTSGTANGSVHIGFPIQKLLAALKNEHAAVLPQLWRVGMMVMWGFLQVVLFFVLFFYCLGSLYDDRRDRSVLFWKSLPVTNASTVWSKVAMATLVVPAVSFGFAVLLQLGLMLLMSAVVLLHGHSAADLVWRPADPLHVWAMMLTTIPLSALWSLPTVGWLMFISAWARSKPFLWAVAVPVITGIAVSLFDIFRAIRLPDSWYWTHIAGRGLLSIYPGSWLFSDKTRAVVRQFENDGPPQILDWSAFGTLVTSANLWIGVAAGLGLIVLATYYRRLREAAD